MIYFSLVYPANVCLRDNGTLFSVADGKFTQHTISYVICSILGHFGGQLSRTASRRIRAIELVHKYIQTGRRTFVLSRLISCPSILLAFLHDSNTLGANQVKAQVEHRPDHQSPCLRMSSATNGHGMLGGSILLDFSFGLTLFPCFDHLESSKCRYRPLI